MLDIVYYGLCALVLFFVVNFVADHGGREFYSRYFGGKP